MVKYIRVTHNMLVYCHYAVISTLIAVKVYAHKRFY